MPSSSYGCLVLFIFLLMNPSVALGTLIFEDGFEPDFTRLDVTWSADVELVEGDAVAALQSVDETGSEFVFSTSLLGDAGVSFVEGDIMLVEGIAMRRIISVSQLNDSTILTTEQAALDEAIVEGEMAWNLNIGFEQVSTASFKLADSQRIVDCSPAVSKNTVSFECSFDDYTMALELTRNGDSSSIQYQVVKGTDEANASFTGTGTLQSFTSSANAEFGSGDLQSFKYDTKNAQMDVNIALAAAGAGSNDLNFEVPFPVISIPFTVGPIPMSIDIGIQFVAVLEVPAEASASATASADFRYRGDSGLTFEGTSVAAEASINDHEFSDGQFDSASNFVSVDAGFGIAFPRISLNVLGSEVAWVRTGFTLQSSLRFGPICKVGIAGLVVQGGYQLSIMGQELLSESETFAERTRREESDGCP